VIPDFATAGLAFLLIFPAALAAWTLVEFVQA
jgi:hypothetical protein